MTTCPHIRLSADVHIKGDGDAPREGALTVRCADCGTPFGFVDAKGENETTVAFRVIPLAPRITIAAAVPEGPLSFSDFGKLLSGKGKP